MTQLQSRYKEKNVKKKKDNCDDVCLNARKRAPHIFMVSFSFFFFSLLCIPPSVALATVQHSK